MFITYNGLNGKINLKVLYLVTYCIHSVCIYMYRSSNNSTASDAVINYGRIKTSLV